MRRIGKRRAKQIAKAILSLEGLESLVDGQLETYPYTDEMTFEDRQLIIAATTEIAQQLHNQSGKESDKLIDSLKRSAD